MRTTKRILLPLLASLMINICAFTQEVPQNLFFQNTPLNFEKRVINLSGYLTLEGKVAKLLHAAPAIPRIGIPAYDWWNEVLHGMERTPCKVTVYPQAIAMAATFDTHLLFTMADYSAHIQLYNQKSTV